MVLSMNWLSDFVKADDIEIKKYCDELTESGSKVEGYEILGEEIENVRVGLITKIEQHPDAERLVICQVDCGERNLQIVTAAKNVFEGALVPLCYCPDGEKRVAKVKGGEIKTGKLRGVLSEGMFCSIEELGLTTHDMPGAAEDGILILNGYDVKPGDDICDALMMRDKAVEFEITPNRPDCLSVIGLARETAATFARELTVPTPVVKENPELGKIEDYLEVKITDTEKCKRYSARVIKNVKIEPSPLWLRMRLRASGVRPINNIVDITNYVMLEYGQPMHAFDYVCLGGKKIDIRTAGDKEIFRTLDSVDHELEPDMLVIADETKPVALAGVMGGENSEITENTSTVVFESAMFHGSSVRITAKKLGMRTEASARFEKGLDCENTLPALERACELVELLGAGEVVPGIIDEYPVKKEVARVPFEPEKISRFLGLNISADEMKKYLERLFFTFDGDEIIVPSYRDDVRCMNDIAEEVVRLYGYNKIESGNMVFPMTQGGLNESQKFKYDLGNLLLGAGYTEICTYSFMNASNYDKIRLAKDDARRKSVEIANPFGEDSKTMRTTALPTLFEVVENSSRSGVENVAIYEMAKVFIPREGVVTNEHGLEGTLPEEKMKLVLGAYGAADFYTLKGAVDKVMQFAGIDASYVACETEPTFHPGRCANVVAADGTILGTFGELHPLTMKNYEFISTVYAAELDLDAIYANASFEKAYKPLPKFPASTRDFSFVCDDALEVGTIEKVMKETNSKLIENVKLFDIYRGAQLGEGKKSVSFSVSFRSPDHTLTVEETDKAAKKILGAIEHKLGITIRQ
ncbi:MAG: phenylalanine--tRNA ligase subunit beta [Clostridia bacterium]|nr:phenylalanine--tRNA ligase subunit beta [Clostridia bacterium]